MPLKGEQTMLIREDETTTDGFRVIRLVVKEVRILHNNADIRYTYGIPMVEIKIGDWS